MGVWLSLCLIFIVLQPFDIATLPEVVCGVGRHCTLANDDEMTIRISNEISQPKHNGSFGLETREK